RGRCRSCRGPISWRYPAVELISVALALLTWWRFGDPLEFLVYFPFFITPLVIVSFIDLEHRIIPDVISIPGIFVGIGASALVAPSGGRIDAALGGLVGAVVGGLSLFLVAWIYEKLKKQEGMGGGDVKLIAMIGAFFGWRASIFILLMSSILGSLVGLSMILALRKDMKYAIPFGPFLAAAGVIYLFVGQRLILWYSNLLM
ncbi:MAG TPA: A24 family peptidase, partial [bacterium]|nr:A24 family peptidase [bacterium]